MQNECFQRNDHSRVPLQHHRRSICETKKIPNLQCMILFLPLLRSWVWNCTSLGIYSRPVLSVHKEVMCQTTVSFFSLITSDNKACSVPSLVLSLPYCYICSTILNVYTQFAPFKIALSNARVGVVSYWY